MCSDPRRSRNRRSRARSWCRVLHSRFWPVASHAGAACASSWCGAMEASNREDRNGPPLSVTMMTTGKFAPVSKSTGQASPAGSGRLRSEARRVKNARRQCDDHGQQRSLIMVSRTKWNCTNPPPEPATTPSARFAASLRAYVGTALLGQVGHDAIQPLGIDRGQWAAAQQERLDAQREQVARELEHHHPDRHVEGQDQQQ